MKSESKYYETGANPCHLNINNTAKNSSLYFDSTNPLNGFMSLLNNNDLVQTEILISEPFIVQEFLICEE